MRDIRGLDLNLLKALDALLEEGSVTRAASRLSLTQPAVSGMLTRLRESFDDPLFVRAQRGIVPTPRAQALAVPVRQVLNEIEQLLQPQAFEPGQASLTLTLAATDYAQRTLVLPLLARVRNEAPGVRLAIRPVDDERVTRQLESGEVDLAILTPETTFEGLHARHLYDERYGVVMRHGHPAAQDLDLDTFCALDHAIVSFSGHAFSGVTDQALAALGRTRRVSLSVTSFLLLLEAVSHSDLIAVVPRRLVSAHDGLHWHEPPLAIAGFAKRAAWHARIHHSAAHRWLRSLLFEVAGLGTH
ncbi:LysR substrate-binding domain-containing protein [Pseudomonas syringae]|nr:LysR family transcriptional regulator [Pseudomonas syringae]